MGALCYPVRMMLRSKVAIFSSLTFVFVVLFLLIRTKDTSLDYNAVTRELRRQRIKIRTELDQNEDVDELREEIQHLQSRYETLLAKSRSDSLGDSSIQSDSLSEQSVQNVRSRSPVKKHRINHQELARRDNDSKTPTERDSFRPTRLPMAELLQLRATKVNCAKLFAGDRGEIERARGFERESASSDSVRAQAQDCARYVVARKYIMKPVSREEAEFPIAFSIIMHNEVEQFERLLRAVYRPQNFYCVHVDYKAHSDVRLAVEAIVRCLPNVFIASHSIDVEWGTFSIVEPELVCMRDLLKRSKKWTYFINLTGQEFPLKTNWDIVKILKVFNGANNMEGTVERRDDTRVTNKPNLPIDVTLTKGSVHIVVTREFVKYVLYNKNAHVFKEWVKDTYVPDETYFSSLNHSPQLGVPGAYLGKPETDTDKYMFIARFKNWGDGPFNWPCAGQRVRYVCVFGVGDLPLLASRPELFANKFYNDFEPAALDCMEELHMNRTKDELTGLKTFDTAFYKRLSFVDNHL